MSETIRVVGLIGDSVEHTVREVTLRVLDNLKAATPVATGWARSNWIPSIGQPVSSPDGTRFNHDGSAQAQGRAMVAFGYKLEYGPIFLSNQVPYIDKLNAGSSPKAPAGFVQRAMDDAVGSIKSGSR